MNQPMLDLYSDYLIASTSYTTATGLEKVTDGSISHDKVTHFLSEEDFTSKHLWGLTKSTVRKIESDEGIIVFDDTVEEKPYTDENELITWHFDHIAGRSVKGVNILSALYHNRGITVPIAFQPIKKTEKVMDLKSGKAKSKSPKTKNEYFREMARIAIQDNRIKCRWVLADVWYSGNDNMECINLELKKDFIMPIKGNRLAALSEVQKRAGQFRRVEEIAIAEHTTLKVYLKDLPFPVLLVKWIFRNEDGSRGVMYLVCSDTTVGADTITEVYQKRWQIEQFHKSIKSNTGLAKSPTKTVRTQNNHFFASIYAYFKLELLKCNTKLNHFALKARLYLQALKASLAELHKFQNLTLAVT
jgi:DDE superfamily endonuclease